MGIRPEDHRALLERCAKTALNSKLISDQQEFFGPLVVDAIQTLDPKDLDLSLIGVKKVPGGSVTVSCFFSSLLVDQLRIRSWSKALRSKRLSRTLDLNNSPRSLRILRLSV